VRTFAFDMPFRGTGYNYPDGNEIYELMVHRRRQLAALSSIARRDDELARELAQLDEDIAAGVAELERLDDESRHVLASTLRRRIEDHRR
jgi:hypothetical protein